MTLDTTETDDEPSIDKYDLNDLDLPKQWLRFQEENSWATRKQFREWLIARLLDPDQIDELGWCSDCEDPVTELTTTGNDGRVCDDCLDNFYSCFHCELYFRETTTVNSDEVCESCLDAYYSWCEDCENYYSGDDCGEGHSCPCEAPAQHFTIRNDGEEVLENDVRVEVALPAGSISAEGLEQIKQYIYDFTYTLDPGNYRGNFFCLIDSLPDLGDRWQTKEGNYTKRLSRLAYKKYQLKVSPDMVSQIGCIARDNSTAVDFHIEVTRNLNLSACDFYHEDSCWWGSYASSRCALKNSGGFGMRTFDSPPSEARTVVTGRAWIMPLKLNEDGNLTPTFETLEPAAFIVFNGYGNLEGYTPARILSHMAGMTYRKISFSCSPMYVNCESGYLVAPEEIAHEYTDGSLHLAVDDHSRLYSRETEVFSLAA